MADVQPFRGVRYSQNAGDLAALTSPPYDVISPAEHERLESSHPRNVVRLILGRDAPDDTSTSSKYTRASAHLRTWLEDGTLVRDGAETFYLYEQRFAIGGEDRVQRGVIGAVELDERWVLPHEHTMAAPVADRLALMRTTRANLEPIICVYGGEDGAARDAMADAIAREPLAAFASGDGVTHRLFAIDDASSVAAIRGALGGARLTIADGHHRYRTAEVYRDERRAADGRGPWDRMMMLLLDAGWSGPAVLPIHRLVSGVDPERALGVLGGPFEIERASTTSAAELEREVAVRAGSAHCYAMLSAAGAWWLTLADKDAADDAMQPDRSPDWRNLDVSVLQALVFDRLLGVTPFYAHSASEVREAVSSGAASLAFVVAPTPFDAVRRVAERGEAMPPKSTYFFPKPRSGVVVRLLDE